MKSRRTASFRKAFASLPESVQSSRDEIHVLSIPFRFAEVVREASHDGPGTVGWLLQEGLGKAEQVGNLLIRTTALGARGAIRRHTEEEQDRMGFLSCPAAGLPQAGLLVGDQREEGRDAAQTAGEADRRVGARKTRLTGQAAQPGHSQLWDMSSSVAVDSRWRGPSSAPRREFHEADRPYS